MNRFGPPTLQRKLSLSAIAIALLLTLPLLYFHLQKIIPVGVQLREEALAAHLERVANDLNSLSREGINIAQNLARQGEFYYRLANSESQVIEREQDWEKIIGSELARHIESFPNIVGGGIFYEPFVFAAEQKHRGFHAHWVPPIGSSRKVEYSISDSNSKLDYQNQGWYRTLIPAGWNAKRHLYKDIAWTAPYRDQVSLIPTLSVLTAMYSEDSRLLGLASVEWNIDYLTQVINESRPTPNTIALLLSPDTKTFAAVAGLEGLNLEPVDRAPWMPYLLLNPPQDRYEMVPGYHDDGSELRVYSRRLDNGLVYSVIIPETDFVPQLALVNREFGLLMILLCAGGILVHHLLIRKFVGSLPELAEVANEYALGQFSRSVTLRSRDELEAISEALCSYRDYVLGFTDSATRLLVGETGNSGTVEGATDPARRVMRELYETISRFHTECRLVESEMYAGESDFRFDSSQFLGEWQQSGRLINRMLNMLEEPMQDVIAVADLVARGESPHLLAGAPGNFERHRLALNGILEKYNESLRKLRIENEALALSRDQAVQLRRSKAQILGNACRSYQLFLKDLLPILAALADGEPFSKYLDRVKPCQSAASDLLALTDDIVSYTELETGQLELCNQEFNLYRTLFNMKDLLQVHALRQRMQFRLDIEKEIPETLIGDVRVLEGILSHISMHSIRHAGENGVISLKVTKIGETDATCTLAFSIVDTGGARLNCEDRIAMGLVIAEQLIELMGGSYSVESKAGLGIHYRFVLPFTSRERHIPADHVDDLIAAVGRIVDPHRQVLLVEDNAVNQKLTSGLLKRAGYDVTVVGNGEEALAVVEQSKFALILMDISLPLIDGIEVARRIRAEEGVCKDVPIVALTAHSFEYSFEQCRAAGMNGYLMKPLDAKALYEVLATLAPFSSQNHEQDSEVIELTNPISETSQ